jgi:hypothetical protein
MVILAHDCASRLPARTQIWRWVLAWQKVTLRIADEDRDVDRQDTTKQINESNQLLNGGIVAEGVRFELTRPLRACQFSRLVP